MTKESHIRNIGYLHDSQGHPIILVSFFLGHPILFSYLAITFDKNNTGKPYSEYKLLAWFLRTPYSFTAIFEGHLSYCSPTLCKVETFVQPSEIEIFSILYIQHILHLNSIFRLNLWRLNWKAFQTCWNGLTVLISQRNVKFRLSQMTQSIFIENTSVRSLDKRKVEYHYKWLLLQPSLE